MSAALYLIATPIGNMKDITFRAVEVLQMVDIVFSEDTRISKKLLNYYKISKKLYSLHKFNEAKNIEQIATYLNLNLNVAILCDAGTPGVSDPGAYIVNYALKNNIKIIPVPGSSALSTSISCCGFLENNKILFLGFLPHKKTKIEKLLLELKNTNIDSIVFFEAANRVKQSLALIKNIFLKAEIVIFRELTKLYEEIRLLDNNYTLTEKGEYTIAVKLNNNFVLLKDDDKINKILSNYLNIETKEAYKILTDLKKKTKNV